MELRQQLIKDIEQLPESILLKINAVIKNSITESVCQFNNIGEKRRAMFGCMKGKMWVSDDFDAPLDDLKEYMD